MLIIPDGASFEDMVVLKEKANIGDQINKNNIAPIAEANNLKGVIDQTDFYDNENLGQWKVKKRSSQQPDRDFPGCHPRFRIEPG